MQNISGPHLYEKKEIIVRSTFMKNVQIYLLQCISFCASFIEYFDVAFDKE